MKELWCSDCRCNHVVKLHSAGELSEPESERFFVEGDYADQPKKHMICGTLRRQYCTHTDIDIMVVNGEWNEICLESLRKH